MRNIAINFGLKMFAGFLLFFLVMHLIGLSDNTNLRILNGVIHLFFIALVIHRYRKEFPDGIGNYLSGVAIGMYASAVGVVLFTIFMFLFLTFTPDLMASIQTTHPIGKYLTPFTASLFLLSEGIVVSLIGSYIMTRLVDYNIVGASI